MAGRFEGRLSGLNESFDGRGWQGKVLKGALNGANFGRGVGQGGPFLHGPWKGAGYWLATVMACRGLGRGYRRKGGKFP